MKTADFAFLFSGVLGAILFVVGIVIAIYWLLFPLIIANQLSRIEKLMQKIAPQITNRLDGIHDSGKYSFEQLHKLSEQLRQTTDHLRAQSALREQAVAPRIDRSFHYTDDAGTVRGPVGERKMRRMMLDGEIAIDTPVCEVGMDNWQRADECL